MFLIGLIGWGWTERLGLANAALNKLEEVEKKRNFEQKRRLHYQVQGGALLKQQRPDQRVRKQKGEGDDEDDE